MIYDDLMSSCCQIWAGNYKCHPYDQSLTIDIILDCYGSQIPNAESDHCCVFTMKECLLICSMTFKITDYFWQWIGLVFREC